MLKNRSFIQLASVLFIAVLLQSCATQNLFTSGPEEQYKIDALLISKTESRLKPDDKISVSIWGHDNLSVGSVFGIYSSNEVYGKWVLINQKGEAVLPRIGAVCLAGLTKEEAVTTLKELYGKFIIDPIIVVKILNREVTVLGEIVTPGNYLLEKDRNTLFEVIGRAGGLNFYANKKKIKLIRYNHEFHFDLTKMDEFALNNINLQSGDIIYIPSSEGKIIDKKAPTLIPLTSLITTLVLIISILK
jgi:polysaccharide export outer membrane protein